MRITKKGQYALFFMIDLALHEGETITVKQVAKTYDLSEKYLEQVAAKLRQAGAVKVIRGSHGGYYLAKDGRDYTVGEILDTIEGQKNAVEIDLDQTSESNKAMNIVIQDLGQAVDSAVDHVLDGMTLTDMVRVYNEQETFSYII